MAIDNLQFRAATSDDAAELQTLIQNAFRAEDKREGWTWIMELASKFHLEIGEITALITNPDSTVLIAIDNGVPVATITARKSGPGYARLILLAVDPSQQHDGLGRQVLHYAEEYCQATWGATKVGLNALSRREGLIAWYTRRGYEKTGKFSPFPFDRFHDVALPEDLNFVEMDKNLVKVPTA